MKNFKRTLALVLAVIMVAGMFAGVSAAKAKWYADAVRYVEGVGIATIGATADEKITRDEFVLWIAKLESGILNDAYWGSAMETPFTDITEENNQTAIWYSARRNLIVGNGDGTFAPDKNITFAEAAAVVVRLMRYTSKVEGEAEDWQWAYMDVANEYCKAFDNTFLDNVGGSIYDYDYELTKGEAAYIIATIMNAPVIPGYQTENDYGKMTYKSLTIDGMNLGERFYAREGSFGVSGNTYMVWSINFNKDGEVDGDVVLTAVSAKADDAVATIKLDEEEFTSLVRVSLGLTAEPAEDEASVRIVDTVKIGNLVDVVLDKDNEVVSINVHSGSIVVDTHIVMDSMLSAAAPYYGNGIANWTADTLVSGASNSNEYRDAIINSNWSSDLLFTWTENKDGSVTLTFKGEKYDFEVVAGEVVSDDIAVYVENAGELEVLDVATIDELIALIPDVATGEVTLIFNDEDLDGEYDTLVVTDDYRSEFDVKFFDNVTINDKYYAEGWSTSATASGKLQLLVLAQGRFGHYSIEDKDGDTDVDDETYVQDAVKEANPDVYGNNYMNPYAVIDLATISSGVIEESTLRTFNNDTTYYVVKVKNAAGAYQTVYIPFDTTKAEEPTFEYTINGVTKELDKALYDWNPVDKLSFAKKENIADLIGVATNAGASEYAQNAAKLVGQYISYIVDEDNVAIYCVSGAASASSGYVLDIAATDVDNTYNATILTVDANGNAKDVAIYSVNATASVMMNKGTNYEVIADLFNKGTVVDGNIYNNSPLTIKVYDNKGVGTTHQAAIALRGDAKFYVKSLINVDVHSNGTFTYLQIDESETGIRFDREDGVWNYNLNGEANVDTSADDWGKKVLSSGAFAKDTSNKTTNFVKVDTTKPTATVSYSGEFYSNPIYRYDSVNNKWALCVTTKTVTVAYTFNVDTMTVTTANVLDIKTTDATLYNALVGVNEATNVGTDKAGKSYLKSLESWVNLTLDKDGKVTAVTNYAVPTTGFDRGTEALTATKTTYTVAGKVVTNDDNSISVDYDFRGIDFTYDVVTDEVSMKKLAGDAAEVAYYSFDNAKVDTADVLAALAAVDADNVPANAKYTGTTSSEATYADATSCISNVTFTKVEAGTPGYIPGTYYFSLNNANKVYFNNLKDDADQNKFIGYTATEVADYLDGNARLDKDDIDSKDRKYRVTSTTEVVLMTPSASGWTVKVMTPAEAAELDLIVTAVSFVDALEADIAAGKVTANKYDPYNYKLDTIVLVGQEALVATEVEKEEDDGKTVGADEYLVWVPNDVETILVAPEGSKTVKVATTKSVYAIPSGTEIGAIFYEYDVYGGTESVKINTEIASGWYIVDEDGEIVEKLAKFETATLDTAGKTNFTHKNNGYITVSGGDVVVGVYKRADKKWTTDTLKTYKLSDVTLLYKDIDGTLKVVADKDAKFASASTFALEMKSAKTAVEAAYTKLNSTTWTPAKEAELKAAYETALAAYNELLAANIDKFFNGDIADSFKSVYATETTIQGDGKYNVSVYTVDDEVFVILNEWTPAGANGVVTVTSNFN